VVSIHSLFSDAPLRRWGEKVIGPCCIEDLSPSLAIVTADILTGDEVVFRRGPLWPAVLASCAIPGVLPAQRIGGRVLVDGGLVDPVPVSVAADMGANVVLAVNLCADQRLRRTEEAATQPLGRAPSVVEVITRAVEIMQSRVAGATIDRVDHDRAAMHRGNGLGPAPFRPWHAVCFERNGRGGGGSAANRGRLALGQAASVCDKLAQAESPDIHRRSVPRPGFVAQADRLSSRLIPPVAATTPVPLLAAPQLGSSIIAPESKQQPRYHLR
jgi:hypothetical protein